MPQWVQLALMGGSAVAGALNNRQSARTSTYDQNQSENSTAQNSAVNSSTTRRDLTPEQQAAMATLSRFSGDLMQNPLAGLEGLKASAGNQINSNYAGALDAIKAKLLANGGGASGKFQRAVRGTELARIGDLSGLEGQFAQMGSQRQLAGAGLAQNLLGMDFGQTTQGQASNIASTSGTSRNYGTGVAPGSAAGGALTGGLGALSSIAGLQAILGANRRSPVNQSGLDYIMNGGYL